MNPCGGEEDSEAAQQKQLLSVVRYDPNSKRSEERKRRVRSRLGDAGTAKRWGLPYRPVLLWAVPFGLVAAASAAVGKLWIERHAALQLVPEVMLPQRSKRAPRSPGEAAPAVALAPAVSETPAPQRRISRRKSTADSPDPAESVLQHGDLESHLVIDGANALRRDRDPERAQLLLQFYLRRYPNGAVREEALALLVEAAQSQEAAATFAARYREEYPAGRFRERVARKDHAKDSDR